MRALILTTLLAAAASPALAQGTADLAPASPWTGDVRLDAPVDVSLLPAGLATAAPAAAPRAERRRGSVVRPLLPAGIGAVLGSWVGYVASQVVRSDWDKESNGEFSTYRLSFAAGGAALGAVTGVLLGNMGTSGSDRMPRMVNSSTRNAITAQEIEGSHARNALELVQALRPRWLQGRGTNSMTETARGTGSGTGASATVDVVPGESPIKVYQDNAFMGDVSVLRTMAIGGIVEVRFFDMAQATYRWGDGHMGGAIELLTAPAQQD